MKKLLLISSLSFSLLAFTSSTSTLPLNQETTVYICKGKYSKKYHYSKSCRGLSNCSTEIYSTTLSAAKKAGRGICGHED